MLSQRTPEQYGLKAQRYHWLSAVLIIAMIPLGMMMQNVEAEATKRILYRGHMIIGALILLITIARIAWGRKDVSPDPPEGLHGIHLRTFHATHVFLYVFIFVLTFSGIAMLISSGIGDILTGGSEALIPTDLSEIAPGRAHGIAAKIYIALLVGHIGGVVFHQTTKSDVLHRMGINVKKSKQRS
ncbi:MAG: cytochrome b/b6 domain-containing protein [Bacteroidota bacterium]